MALDLGELSARLSTDSSGFRRGLDESRRDLDRFSRDVNGRLRDARGRFVTEGEAAGRGFGDGLDRGARPGTNRFNRLLRNTVDLAGRGAAGIQGLAGSFGDLVKSNPQAVVGAVGIGLGVLPVAAGVAASAITLGLGGAIAGIGIKAAASSTRVKREFADLSEDVGDELKDLAKPFEKSLLGMIRTARKDLGGLSDDLGRSFESLAPRVQGMAAQVSKAIGGLGPEIALIAQKAGPLLDIFGVELKNLINSLGSDFARLAVAADPRFITVLIGAVKGLSTVLTEVIVRFSQVGSWLLDIADKIPGIDFDEPADSLSRFGEGLDGISSKAPAAVSAAEQVAKGLEAAGDSAGDLAKQTAGAQSALEAFFNPSIRLYDATNNVKQSIQGLAEALKNSKGSLEGNSAAVLRSQDAFSGVLKDVVSLRDATLAKTGSDAKARAEVEKFLPVLYALTGGSKDAKSQVDAFAKSIGTVPGAVLPTREEFGKLAKALGLTTEQANIFFKALDRRAILKADITDLRAKLNEAQERFANLPKEKQAKVKGDIDDLKKKLRAAQEALDDLRDKKITVTILQKRIDASFNRLDGYGKKDGGATGGLYDGRRFRYGSGGLVRGPGTGTSDDVQAPWLSNGEYVIRQASVRKYGVAALDAINKGRPAPEPKGTKEELASSSSVRPSGGKAANGTLNPRPLGSVQALIDGIASLEASRIQSAIGKLNDAVKKAFAKVAKRTNIDDVLLKRIASDNKKLEQLAIKREAVAGRIKEALEYAASVSGGAKSFASLGSVAAQLGTDEEGNAIAPTATGLAAGLRERLASLQDYAGDIKSLIGSGLSKTVIDQLLRDGPEQSSAIADAIAAGGPPAIAEINNIQAQIDAVSKQLGEAGADYLYDAGAKAGQGFLAGLKGQLDELEQAAEILAEKLVATVEAGIKKAAALTQGEKLGKAVATTEGKAKPKSKAQSQFAGSGGGPAAGKQKTGQGFYIENYHEAPRGNARQTAEEVLFLAKARG